MTKELVFETAKTALVDLLNQPGRILYSSYTTLQKGDAYFLGFNPGGEGGQLLRDVLPELLDRKGNAYLDEVWTPGGKPRDQGKAPLQLRTVGLLHDLGFAPRNVCASNLIFVRSRASDGVPLHLADVCWPVHQAILGVVQPKVILCCGNSRRSAYGYLHDRFGGPETSVPSGHGNWSVRGFTAEIDKRFYCVVGLPHLSRYEPRAKHSVLEWIRRFAHLATPSATNL